MKENINNCEGDVNANINISICDNRELKIFFLTLNKFENKATR